METATRDFELDWADHIIRALPGNGMKKAARILVEDSELTQVDPRLDYRTDEDLFFIKKHASAFFGTPLLSTLLNLGIDTLICTGMSTNHSDLVSLKLCGLE